MARVLIADNDRAVNGLLRDVLAQYGIPAEQSFDGRDAMVRAREPGIRVLVCDLDMPQADGSEVLESLADLPSPPQAIVVSGYLDGAMRARLAALPFVREVLAKPFDLLGFAALVRELVAAAPLAGEGEQTA